MTASYPLVRSFKPRRRKLGAQTEAIHDRLAPLWCLSVEGPQLDMAQLFAVDRSDGAAGHETTTVLDIGFGYGDALVEVARANQAEQVIGIDVHTPGIASVLVAIERHGLGNIRLVNGDVMEFMPRLPHASLDGVRIYFPDPWPKVRHHHRRIVRPGVVDDLVDRMRIGAQLHLATDIADYAEQMAVVCGANLRLAGGVVPRPERRPVTSFERRGLAAGRDATDLVYVRVS